MGAVSTGKICATVLKLLNQSSRDSRGAVCLRTICILNRGSGSQLGSRVYSQSLGSPAEAWTKFFASVSRPASVQLGRTGFSGSCRVTFNDLPRSNIWRLNGACRYSKETGSAVVVSEGALAVGQVAAASLGSRSAHALKRREGILQVIAHYGKCYFELSKARLSFFVVGSAAVGYVMGSGEVVDWAGLAWTSVGTMLAAASANSFNQILEVANDGLMKRTMRRPLPAGRMSMHHALAFAVTTGITGVTLLACKTTSLAAELGAANVLLYSLVYTPLKQIHYVNTWVGAVVGAIPPLMGWAAATGCIDAGGWVLASALYFWQIPHFMALAFLCRHDYAAGGYKMLSLLDVSGQRIASCALRNCIYLLPLGLLAQHLGITSGYFGAENIVLTSAIGVISVLFYLQPSPESARRLFRVSLLYLPVVMSAMVIHRIPNSKLSAQRLSVAETAGHGKVLCSDVIRTTADDDELTVTVQQRRWKDLPPPPIAFLSAAPFPFLPTPHYCDR